MKMLLRPSLAPFCQIFAIYYHLYVLLILLHFIKIFQIFIMPFYRHIKTLSSFVGNFIIRVYKIVYVSLLCIDVKIFLVIKQSLKTYFSIINQNYKYKKYMSKLFLKWNLFLWSFYFRSKFLFFLSIILLFEKME